MPYQNNNNRVNPKEVVDVSLNLKATPVNNLVQYYPDESITKRGNAVSDALIRLGQGLIDIEPVWQRQADEAVLQNFHDENSNAREWADVSKNIKGFAMFNPYLKEAYKRKQAEEITRSAMIQISSNPNLSKLSNEEYTKYITDITQDVYKQLKDKKLGQQDYSLSMTGFNEFLNNVEKKYYVENSRYQYELFKKSEITGLNRKLFLIADDENFISNFNGVIKDTVSELSKYIPDDEISEMLWTSLVNYVGINAENVDENKLITALNNIDINGKNIEDFRPTYQAEVRKLISEAEYSQYQKKERKYREHQLDLKINQEKALDEFYNFFKNNPTADFNSQFEFLNQLVDKYGLSGEEGFSFLNTLASSKDTYFRLKQIKTDPYVKSELISKLCNENLSYEDIVSAMEDGNLNPDDALNLYRDLQNKDKKIADETLKRAIKFENELGSDRSALRQRLDNSGLDEKIYNPFISEINSLRNDYELGLITADELKSKLDENEAQLQRIIRAKELGNRENSRKLNGNVILESKYVNQQKMLVPSKFKNKNEKELAKDLEKVLPANWGTKIVVTSTPTKKRGNTYHGGYDIGFSEGTPVRVPNKKGNSKMKAKVAAVGFDPDGFGNYIVIEYEDGTFVRMGHLQQNVSKALPVGTSLYQKQMIGRVGNTGRSTGSHLHIDFWKQGKGLIPVDLF